MITDAREYVAGLLTDLGIPVHAYPPPTAVMPVAVIVPDDPYFTVLTLGPDQAVIGLTVHVIVSTASHDSSTRTLDGLIADVTALLRNTPVAIGPIPPPVHEEDQSALTARIPVSVYWKE